MATLDDPFSPLRSEFRRVLSQLGLIGQETVDLGEVAAPLGGGDERPEALSLEAALVVEDSGQLTLDRVVVEVRQLAVQELSHQPPGRVVEGGEEGHRVEVAGARRGGGGDRRDHRTNAGVDHQLDLDHRQNPLPPRRAALEQDASQGPLARADR